MVWKVVEACLKMVCWYSEGGLEDGLNMFGGWLRGDLMVVWQWSGGAFAGGFQLLSGLWFGRDLSGEEPRRPSKHHPNCLPTITQATCQTAHRQPETTSNLPSNSLQTTFQVTLQTNIQTPS